MSKQDEAEQAPDGKRKMTRLEDMDVSFVSLVTAGANRQRSFMILKAVTCPECGKQIDPSEGVCPECGAKLPAFMQALKADVPPQDASNEDKQAALDARSKKFGIEALSVGAALSYPADAPTTTDLYADPVNLKYPLGGPTNARDLGRIRNAAARFAQNVGVYSSDKSKGIIWGRIVSAALDAGIEHAPNDLDALLPSDVKTRLASEREAKKMDQQSASPSEPTQAAATLQGFVAKLAAASQAIAQSIAEVAFAKAAAAEAPAPVVPPAASPAPAPVETAKAAEDDTVAKALAEREAELTATRVELEKARQAKVAAEARMRALSATVGTSHALPTGEVAKAAQKPNARKPIWAPDMNTLRKEQEKTNG